MREGNFYNTSKRVAKDNDFDERAAFISYEFNFGDELHRDIIIDDPNFCYGHYVVGKGQATVGGIRLGNKLYYAVALCSPNNNFSKMTGRDYANGHFIVNKYSNKRGVIILNDALCAQPPAILLKLALEKHLFKMRNKPHWTRNAEVDFRTTRRHFKESQTPWHPPHGAMRRPGSR